MGKRFAIVLGAALVLQGCGLVAAKGPLAGQTRWPAFPEPGPEPAAQVVFADTDPNLEEGEDDNLRNRHRWMTEVLEAAGFEHWSVYAHGEGFAVVTSWEQLDADGTSPSRNRFIARHPKRLKTDFDFDRHTEVLFNAPDGDYRLFVITVGGEGDAPSSKVPIDGDAVSPGGLPDEVGDRPGLADVTVRVYVFHQRGDGKADAVPTEADAAAHLSAAGIVLE